MQWLNSGDKKVNNISKYNTLLTIMKIKGIIKKGDIIIEKRKGDKNEKL